MLMNLAAADRCTAIDVWVFDAKFGHPYAKDAKESRKTRNQVKEILEFFRALRVIFAPFAYGRWFLPQEANAASMSLAMSSGLSVGA
jgi:hypothetical protein